MMRADLGTHLPYCSSRSQALYNQLGLVWVLKIAGALASDTGVPLLIFSLYRHKSLPQKVEPQTDCVLF